MQTQHGGTAHCSYKMPPDGRRAAPFKLNMAVLRTVVTKCRQKAGVRYDRRRRMPNSVKTLQWLVPFFFFSDRSSQYIYLNINQLDALNFIISLFQASTCFEHHVLIIRRPKFYYTVSGIITPIGGRPVQPVHRTATYRCDDTRGCIIQFWPPDDEHVVLETCRGVK